MVSHGASRFQSGRGAWLEVFTFAFNESWILPHFVKHYRAIDPACAITVFDNGSTDGTQDIAASMGCSVQSFETGGKRSDMAMAAIKNTCWKSSLADWVVVCDCDEFLHVSLRSLANEAEKGVSILRVHGFEVVGAAGVPLKRKGSYPSIWYCKSICFRPEKIHAINYSPGAHHCSPGGSVVYSKNFYRLDHYRYISYRLLLKKHLRHSQRTGAEEVAAGYGLGYHIYDPFVIAASYRSAKRYGRKWRLFRLILPFYAYSLWLKLFKT